MQSRYSRLKPTSLFLIWSICLSLILFSSWHAYREKVNSSILLSHLCRSVHWLRDQRSGNVCCAPRRWRPQPHTGIRHSASTPWRKLPRSCTSAATPPGQTRQTLLSPPPHPGSPYIHFPIVHAACCPIPKKVKIDPCLHVLLASHQTRHWRLAHRWIQRCFYCLFLPLPLTQIWCRGFIFTDWSTTYMILFLCSGIRITWSLFFRSIGVSLDTAAILMTRVSLDTFSI